MRVAVMSYRVCRCGEAFYPEAAAERRCPNCRGSEITPDLFEALRYLPHRSRRRSRPRRLTEELSDERQRRS
jgi:hypothetical protein